MNIKYVKRNLYYHDKTVTSIRKNPVSWFEIGADGAKMIHIL
jgi:hypothetical protein